MFKKNISQPAIKNFSGFIKNIGVKISKKYPQFEELTALFIVTGKLEAEYLIANNGRIEQVGKFKVHPADYPDRAGYSRVMGHGRTYSYESFGAGKDTWRLKEFKEELSKKIPELIRKYKPQKIYLFSEKEVLRTVKDLIPKSSQKVVAGEFAINLTGAHPFDFLEKILEANKDIGSSVPANKQANKILKRRVK